MEKNNSLAPGLTRCDLCSSSAVHIDSNGVALCVRHAKDAMNKSAELIEVPIKTVPATLAKQYKK